MQTNSSTMKRAFVYISLLMLLISCGADETPRYTIQGKNIGEGTAFLFGSDGNYSELGAINCNGSFSYSIPLTKPTILTLVLPDSRSFALFAEPGVTAVLQSDTKNNGRWSIKGGELQALHDSISVILDATTDKGKQKKIIDEFSKSHPVSEVNIELYRRYLVDIPDPDNESLRRSIQKLGGALQDHEYFTSLKKQLDKKSGNVKHKMFPTFNYTTIDEKKVSTSTYANKHLLVTFWSTLDNECRKSMQVMREIRQKFNEDELGILNIAIDQDIAKLNEVITADSIVGDNTHDRKGLNSDVVSTFNLTSLPYSILVTPYKRISEYGLELDEKGFALIESLVEKHKASTKDKEKNKNKK